MPPLIKRGGRSKRDAKKWRCKRCKRVNHPTEHLIFNLPTFRCQCGKQFRGDFHFCLSDIKVNGHLLLGDIHCQGSTDYCVAYAFAHQLEITLRLKALLKKRDPLAVKELSGNKLFEMFKKRCKDYFPKEKSTIKKRAYIKQVHMGLILKEEGIKNEDGKLFKVSNVSTIPKDDFEGIARSIAEGGPLVSSFNSGKRLRKLKYGQIYKAYLRTRYRGNKKKKLTGHAVCLIGVGRKKGKPYCSFLNSWKDFCVRRNRRGRKYKWGVGRIRASDLKCSAIRLSRFCEPGDKWSLQLQEGTVLSEHNLHVMTASIHEVENELGINGHESDDDCEALDNTMLGSLTDKSKLDAQPEFFSHFVPDKTTNKLTLIDIGVSRTKLDLVNLGTIAKFAMKEFMEALAAGADVSMLGQFVAGYLAERVVVTIKHSDCEQCVWDSQAGGFFAVTHDTGAPTLKVYQGFCVRRNRRGRKYKWGVGRVRASDLKCSAIRLSRFCEPGDKWSLQPQEGTVLSEHNLHVMTASIHEVENELGINGHESDDDCEALDNTMLGSLTDKSKLDAQPELFSHFVPDKTTNKLTLIDIGVSRTKLDLVDLGTIAKFAMKEFMEALAAGADVSMLGQFVAGYLAERVVVTIKHSDCEQCVWDSQAGGFFAVTHDTGAPTLKVYQLSYPELLRPINNQKPVWIKKPEDR